MSLLIKIKKIYIRKERLNNLFKNKKSRDIVIYNKENKIYLTL